FPTILFRNKRDKPECTVNVGGVLNFEVEILATKCINDGSATTFSIYTHGLNDKMRLTVQTNCSCSCSKVPRQINSPKCSNHGIYECGVCTCAKGFYGRECECDTASPTIESKIERCKKPGSSDVCSGRGQCVCGRCKCEIATIEPGLYKTQVNIQKTKNKLYSYFLHRSIFDSIVGDAVSHSHSRP
ncbi:unnamed protein product, partial [Rotaria sp. Silwood1]